MSITFSASVRDSGLICFRRRFLFVHIPKAAGTSVVAALAPLVYSRMRIIANRWLVRLAEMNDWRYGKPFYWMNVFPKHLKGHEWRDAVTSEVFANLFKFAFVRNPWDWQVSIFHFTLQNDTHPLHQLFHSFSGFEEYMNWRMNGNLETQICYLTDTKGKPLMNFVGRYESLAQDFSHICQTLNLGNISLPHINPSKHRDYRSYYNQRTRDMVAKAFREDIERLGYTFDGQVSQNLPIAC